VHGRTTSAAPSPQDYKPDYPEERRRAKHVQEKKEWKLKRATAREAAVAADRATNQMAQLATGSSGPGAKMALDVPGPAAAAPLGDRTDDLSNSPVAFLFPGQGSQSVGMLKSIAHLPAVKAMCDTAAAVLGYDLLDVCVNGPKEKLDDTVYAQPALFVAGLAAVEKLRADDPGAVERCSRTAGLSLGEYTALVFSGAMTFEDGLRVVKVRAQSSPQTLTSCTLTPLHPQAR
jgi:[acyl-carrier-protein] S-malonyltransferase